MATPNTTFTVGQVLTSQQQNNFPFGIVGQVRKTDANFSMTTTPTTITGVSITFTGIAGRIYKASFQGLCQKGSDDNDVIFKIFQGATQISQSEEFRSSGMYNIPNGMTTFTATGSTTMTVQAYTGAGTATLYCAAVNPFTFVIEDIGTT
jgi:hypothetical protein